MDFNRDIWLDTDIGTDIDDSWALAFLLRSPELLLHGISTVTGDTRYRARIAERLLRAEKISLPVRPGESAPDDEHIMLSLAEGDSPDGVRTRFTDTAVPENIAAALGTMKKNPAVIAIGPMTNLAETLVRFPGCECSCDLIAMAGAVQDASAQAPEYNIRVDIDAAARVMDGKWKSITLLPFELCRQITLPGSFPEILEASGDPLCVELARQNALWNERVRGGGKHPFTSPLFDTAPVAFAYDESFFHVRETSVRVTPDGRTPEDADGRKIRLAYGWRDLPGFLELLKSRLLPDR